ncbi:Lysophospholipase D GDPD1 [Nymphon striatum]|nr:Lysophospholipase D GDPD1 [Nymphon striatum]
MVTLLFVLGLVDFGTKYKIISQSCTNHKDRKIPLLEELFKRYPQMPINIDIKIDNDDLIKQVSDMIVKYNRESLTVWGNYRNKITYKCHKENPNVPTLFSVQRVIMLLVFTYTGLLPFIPLRESCLELFLPHIFYKVKPELMSSQRGGLFSFLLTMADKLLMRRFIFEHLKKRDIQVFLWVLNDEEDFKKALDLGATGIMTDYPTKLRKFLDDNPQYMKKIESKENDM